MLSREERSELEAEYKLEPTIGDLHNIAYTSVMEVFIKDDSAKPMLSLIEPHFITSLGDILTFGAQKYSKNNWKLCEDSTRYKDALLRHTYAYLSGELIDPESGFPHTAHIACNIMFLQWFDAQ